ncbi:acyltransferase family protein [bacterium]|nr:acyltransferase family protein [bacterium]
MTRTQRRAAVKLAKQLLSDQEFQHLLGIEADDNGFGYDHFGMEKESVILAFAFASYLHKYYFRVLSKGIENVPLCGRAILTPNHSGVIPIDASMLAVDVLFRMKKPRVLRAMVDNFAGFLPFVNVFFNRVGQVVGARRNFEDLLRHDQLLAVFPEGAKGTGKLFSERYKLLRFNVGFVELSLRYKAPIVPVSIIGPEEQAPMIGNIKPLARMLGFPYFPITPFFPWLGPLGAIPMPVRYHVTYGEPIHLYEEYGPETINNPERIRMLADRVQMIVQDMIVHGLDERQSVFA